MSDSDMKFEGKKYQENKSLNTTDIAKNIRTELKELKGSKFSVTTKCYSGGSSINIHLMSSGVKVVRAPEEITEDHLLRLGRVCELSDLKKCQTTGYHQLNEYTLREEWEEDSWCNGVFLTKEGHELLQKVIGIVDAYNFDDSDSMTDYFHVKFYSHLSIGKWDKPFTQTGGI